METDITASGAEGIEYLGLMNTLRSFTYLRHTASPESWRHQEFKVGHLCRTLRFETQGRRFLQIEDEDLYRKGVELFGKDFAAKFLTSTAFEIDEAGKCLAVGRATASVFLLMRV